MTINAYLRHIHAKISKCDVKEINQIRACISLAFPYPLLDKDINFHTF